MAYPPATPQSTTDHLSNISVVQGDSHRPSYSTQLVLEGLNYGGPCISLIENQRKHIPGDLAATLAALQELPYHGTQSDISQDVVMFAQSCLNGLYSFSSNYSEKLCEGA